MIGNAIAGLYGGGVPPIPETSYQSIATVSASGGETSLSFTSIPNTFTHLQIRGILKDTFTTSTSVGCYVTFNSDSGSNYAYHKLYATGSAVYAGATTTQSNIFLWGSGASSASGTSNMFGVSVTDILDYASTSKYKTLRTLNGSDLNASGTIAINSGLWQSTSAISSIQIAKDYTAFAAGTTFALYGIKGA
jgi:hypothetical protein